SRSNRLLVLRPEEVEVPSGRYKINVVSNGFGRVGGNGHENQKRTGFVSAGFQPLLSFTLGGAADNAQCGLFRGKFMVASDLGCLGRWHVQKMRARLRSGTDPQCSDHYLSIAGR